MTQRFEPVFDMYAVTPPEGDWRYVLDDYDVAYGPGWWPFHRDGRATQVRLSPDTAFLSWRNEYVLASPPTSPRSPTASARFRLSLRRQGSGAMVVPVRVTVDLRAGAVRWPDGLPGELRGQAAMKGERLVDLVRAARGERRRGVARPTTAHDQAGPAT
jgi:hypothetical protein